MQVNGVNQGVKGLALEPLVGFRGIAPGGGTCGQSSGSFGFNGLNKLIFGNVCKNFKLNDIEKVSHDSILLVGGPRAEPWKLKNFNLVKMLQVGKFKAYF